MKNCDDCKYLYDLEPCYNIVKCVNGNMFEAMEKNDDDSVDPDDIAKQEVCDMDNSKIEIIFDLMKHPDELEALANALTDVDTCQIWESDAIFKAADVLIGLSQISKASVSDIFSNFGGV